MTRLQWFRLKDLVPDNSIYIKSEPRAIGTEKVWVEDWPPYGGGGGGRYEEKEIKEEMHLFQVPEPL